MLDSLHRLQRTTHTVERQYFERVKESPTRSVTTINFERLKRCLPRFALMAGTCGTQGGWGEFLKCLDLYSQELLDRSEMIELTTEIFCSRGLSKELFDTFKKLLQSQDEFEELQVSMPKKHSHHITQPDSREQGGSSFWGASTPLHEIDFSRCKHATPSYRALPTSMSRPRCGERSGLDSFVLNDVWVSQPVGSEGTYSFKHVEKNQFEEELFECEDKRFEVDVVINSNASAIVVLEIINTEVRKNENSTAILSMPNEDAYHDRNYYFPRGEATNVIGFKLGVKTLSAVHMNAIMRAYGEHGADGQCPFKYTF